MGIAYQTPEEYFLNEAAHPYARDFDPSTYLDPASSAPTDTSKSKLAQRLGDDHTKSGIALIAMENKNPLDIVLFCGSPGSGKSTFYWQNLRRLGYERVNQDQLKSVNRPL